MASGSPAGRANSSAAKAGFDFASDDILCSYQDYAEQEAANGNHSDPATGSNSSKDFHKNKVLRSSAHHTTNLYTQPEDSVNQEVVVAIEKTIKKSTENLMRFLEGISSRLSQLELYCYNLDKSVGEMRSELQHDHGETEAKLKSVDKHVQEVHRSVQILRDKQELAETQKELAKLQLAQKGSSNPQDEKVSTPSSAKTKTDDAAEMHNLQLALALPNQAPPQPCNPVRAPEQQQQQQQAITLSQPMTQQASYYVPAATQLHNIPSAQHQPQPPQGSYVAVDPQYRAPQMVQSSSQGQVTQSQQFHQYQQQQQQWSQQPVQPPQQQPMQPIYYMQTQAANPTPQEATLTSPMPMQVPLPGFPHQTVSSRAEVVSFGPGGPPQHMKPANGYSAPSGGGGGGGGAYMIYESDGTRTPHSPPPMHFTQGGYTTGGSIVIRGPSPPLQFVQAHPYNELINKLTSMGYRGELVTSIIQRLEETGQPVDFNAVLDRLNGNSSGGSQRSW